MNDDEVAAKLSARIRSWKSCVGNGFELEAPYPDPEPNQLKDTRPGVSEGVVTSLAAVPVPARENGTHRQPPPDPREAQIHDLRETLAAERERAQFLEQTLLREQALQAASLMAQAQERARKEQREARVTPEPAPHYSRGLDVHHFRRRKGQEMALQVVALLMVVLLGCGGWYLLFRAF